MLPGCLINMNYVANIIRLFTETLKLTPLLRKRGIFNNRRTS